jgi:hypothetical protein
VEVEFFNQPSTSRFSQDFGNLLSEGGYLLSAVKFFNPGFSLFFIVAIIAFYSIGRILVLLVFRHHRFLQHRQDIGSFITF